MLRLVAEDVKYIMDGTTPYKTPGLRKRSVNDKIKQTRKIHCCSWKATRYVRYRKVL